MSGANVSKKEAFAVIEKIHPKVKSWRLFDEFTIAVLDDLLEKMTKANSTIVGHVCKIIGETSHLEKIKDQLQSDILRSLETKDCKSLMQLEKLITNNGEVDKNLIALLGAVQYNILLEQRLKRLSEMITIIDDVFPKESKRKNAKDCLLKYGLNLQLIWDYCEEKCESLAEKNLFGREIRGAEVSSL